jgi:hypothetical protein
MDTRDAAAGFRITLGRKAARGPAQGKDARRHTKLRPRGFSAAYPQADHEGFSLRSNGLLHIPAQALDDFSTAPWVNGLNGR